MQYKPYRTPHFALVLSYGAVPGQRPRTSLFELTGCGEGKTAWGYQGHVIGAKTKRHIEARDVLEIWRGLPSDQQVARVRSHLQPIRDELLAYTVETALATGAFRTRNKLYAAIARGDIETWKDGRSRMISAASLRRYVARRSEAEAASRESTPDRFP